MLNKRQPVDGGFKFYAPEVSINYKLHFSENCNL